VTKNRPANGAAENGAAEGGAPAESATRDRTPADRTPAGRAAAAAKSEGQSARPPYEKARDELAGLVKRLEAGGLTLEQSLELWERGEQLADVCEEWLEGARARLAAAVARRDEAATPAGAPETPF
jgi:exodeoxyribonuclease VII small subunit